MSARFLSYLQREHDRLEVAIADLQSRCVPDTATIARLKKQKLAVKDQISQWQRDCIVTA